MTEQMGLVLIALSAGVVSCLDVLSYEREGIQRDWTRDTPRNGGWLLPSLVLFLIILYLVDGLAGNWNATLSLFGWMAGFFLQISVYFVLLALALPLLRRYLRAEACAMLWIVPNYLYVTTYTRSWNQPRWIIPLPIKFIGAAAVIWLAGTVAVLAWKILPISGFAAGCSGMRRRSPIRGAGRMARRIASGGGEGVGVYSGDLPG